MRYVLCSLYLTNMHMHSGRWGGGGPPRQLSTPKMFLFRSVVNVYILSLKPVMGDIYMLKFEFYISECVFEMLSLSVPIFSAGQGSAASVLRPLQY